MRPLVYCCLAMLVIFAMRFQEYLWDVLLLAGGLVMFCWVVRDVDDYLCEQGYIRRVHVQYTPNDFKHLRQSPPVEASVEEVKK